MGKIKKVSKAVKQQYGMRTTVSQAEITELEAATDGKKPIDLDKLIADSKSR